MSTTESPLAATSPHPDAAASSNDTTPSGPDQVDALIAELRASLVTSQTLVNTQTTRLSHLSDVETELAQLKDQFSFIKAAKEAVEKQLQEEIKRREVAEENVDLLRGQVEQARRGVGMLQKQEKERKRLSQLPPGTALGPGPGPVEGEEVLSEKEVKASRRQSALGRGHRRASSNSEPADVHLLTGSTSPNISAPRAGGLRELRLGASAFASGLPSSTMTSPIFPSDDSQFPASSGTNQRSKRESKDSGSIESGPSKAETAAQDEATRLKAELAQVHARLVESEEARQASEVCLQALRNFMASGGEGDAPADEDVLKHMRLPPLPTDRDPDELEPEATVGKKGGAAGWGFKLWKQTGPTSPALSTAVEPPATPAENLSPPPSNRSSTTPKVSPMPTPGEMPPTENNINAMPSSSTPLANFVTGWTKTVSPGTPASEKPSAGRTLSSFFSRGGVKREDGKEKELPPQPEESGATAGLEPSPEIGEQQGEAKKDQRAVKRGSASTETNGAGEELETPQSSFQEVDLDAGAKGAEHNSAGVAV